MTNDSMPLPKVLLWGGTSKAHIAYEMLREFKLGQPALIFDHTREKAEFDSDCLFVNQSQELKKHIRQLTHFVVCIGGDHGYARTKTAEHLEKLGLKPIPLIHSESFIDPTAKIGKGCQMMPFSVVHKFTRIEDHVVLNTSAVVDHDSRIGKGVHIMGSAAIAGCVEIGDYATIGTNATVLPFIKIGEGAFVGAGAVVNRNVEAYTVVAGVPARYLRKNELLYHDDPLKDLT